MATLRHTISLVKKMRLDGNSTQLEMMKSEPRAESTEEAKETVMRTSVLPSMAG